MKTVSIYPNVKRDGNLLCTKEVISLFRAWGVKVLLSRDLEDHLPGEDGVEWVSEDALFSQSQCLVTLGGDGTILSVARRAAEAGIPICGINLGKVGFMASLEKSQPAKLSRLISGDYTISSRMMLQCRINGKEELCALNECVIVPEKGVHIVELDLYTGRKKLCGFRADGVIFNTPTGSTGYSFSAGGAVVDAEFDCIGVKAISSYLLRGAHHMVFRPETVFTVKNLRSEGARVTVCADGREERILKEGDTVKFCRSEKRVNLITFGPVSNQEIFFRKF